MREMMEDEISVQVVFHGKKVLPKLFKWHNKIHRVEKVNLMHRAKYGNILFCFFSVRNTSKFYKLRFNTQELSWHIVEYYAD